MIIALLPLDLSPFANYFFSVEGEKNISFSGAKSCSESLMSFFSGKRRGKFSLVAQWGKTEKNIKLAETKNSQNNQLKTS